LTLDLGMKAEDKGAMFHIRKVDMVNERDQPELVRKSMNRQIDLQ